MSPTQLETRIQEFLDGVLPEDHWPELRDELAQSESARELYCYYARMHSLLMQRSKGVAALSSNVSVIPIDAMMQSQRKRSLRLAMMAAAALLLITLVTMRLIFVPEQPPMLTFRISEGTQFEMTHDGSGEAPEGMSLEEGSRLRLTEGTVELNFGTGVRSIVMAPADLTLHDKDHLFLNQGTAWFHVPREAVGFQVQTKDLDIVDLGTKFGVIAHPDRHDEVHVFKGKVQLTANRLRKESAVLEGGQGRRIDPIGRLDSVPTRASAFLTELPTTVPYLHWSFDGKGRDLYRVTGSHPAAQDMLSKAVSIDHLDPFTSTEGKFGTALSSFGRNGHVTTDWPGIAGNAPRTISYWLRLPPKAQYLHPIVGWGDRTYPSSSPNTAHFFSFVKTVKGGGTTVALSCGAYEHTATTSIADGQWHHIAHVYSGRSKSDGDPEVYCYIDGRLEQVSVYVDPRIPRDVDGNISIDTVTDSSSAVPLKLFNHLWLTKWEDYKISPSIDELFVFEAALSSRQIANLYRWNRHEK